ncbi:MAG: metal-dependent hydrolase [Candidatus Levybacteria bacterium]|nr:metal-dependent hydrolase [Candidatus Levybacteria bacterium]
MIGRTHDLAAFTALSYIVATSSLQQMSLATLITAFSANMIGGLAPDIDKATSNFWDHIPAGFIFGRLFSPVFGRHRFISHSVVGIVIFGFGLQYLLGLVSKVLIADMSIIWWAFMIGFVSHLIADSFTKDGVPWLFPIPIHLGFPPFKFLRIKTGGLLEKSVVFPGLVILNVYFYYAYSSQFLDFLKHYIK